MSGFTGDIPSGPAGPRNLVEALSGARSLPADALRRAASQPDRVADAVLATARAAAAGQLSDRQVNLLFWGVHALAQACDTRLFGPLMRMLPRSEEDIDRLLGDAVTGTLPRIVIGTFDGDADLLEAAIRDPRVDGFARWSLFGAYAYLASIGQIERARAHDFLVRFDAERPARAGEPPWVGWEEAIALLGFSDLADKVAAARADARLLEDASDPEWFALTLAEATARPEDGSRFADRHLGPLEDAVAELDAMLAEAEEDLDPEEPAQNPHRDVGRNDPCPCGSGEKFKRCCLGRSGSGPEMA